MQLANTSLKTIFHRNTKRRLYFKNNSQVLQYAEKLNENGVSGGVSVLINKKRPTFVTY